MQGGPPVASVLVVSGYGGRASEEWDYLRDALRGLARQDFAQPFEVILIDASPPGEVMPSDVVGVLPSVHVLSGVKEKSCELLNAAVERAKAKLVVLLDGDCVPAPRWLAAAVAAIRSRPDAAAVSGLTVYPDTGFTNRVLGTLSRSFLDPGGPGRTRFISNNNAIVLREALLRHPLGPPPHALAARLQTEAIRLDGGGLYFEPDMRVEHRFDGWEMERKTRRKVGYRAIRVRQLDPRVPHAWMLKLGVFSIPLILAARTVDSFWDCVRAGKHYGLRWFDLPAAFATAVYVHLLEIRGMLAALYEARLAEPPR